jgi:hypothetical protein
MAVGAIVALVCGEPTRGPPDPDLKPFNAGARAVNLGTILLVILVLFLIGALPTWPHSASWGYYPSGGLGVLIVVVIILLVLGRI